MSVVRSYGSPARVPGRGLVDTMTYVAWADGRLVSREFAAARSVVTVLGIADLATQRPFFLRQTPREPARLAVTDLEPRESELVFVTGVWMAMSDGVVDASEERALRIVQGRLNLDPRRSEALEDLVFRLSGQDDWSTRFREIVRSIPWGSA